MKLIKILVIILILCIFLADITPASEYIIFEEPVDKPNISSLEDNIQEEEQKEGVIQMFQIRILFGLSIIFIFFFFLITSAGASQVFQAIENGDLEEVEELIEKEPEVINTVKNVSEGFTPLHWAARKGQKEIAGLLIEKGADVNIINDYGSTPLLYAAMNGHKEIVSLLIEKGVDVNIVNNYGFSPLYFAVEGGYKEIAQLLVKEGADVNAENNEGANPLLAAKYNGHSDMILFLVKYGAKVTPPEASDK